MKQELKLQAYLDGELSEHEAREVSAWLEANADARALSTELSQTRLLLRGNEPEASLPETREFYWSKIEREIARLEAEPARASLPWWLALVRRHLAIVSGTGVAALLAFTAALQMNWVSPDLLEEIENPLEETSSFSFRSESQKMTVVWISNPSTAPAAEDDVDPFEDIP
jgi:anti-sigma factor RsiW